MRILEPLRRRTQSTLSALHKADSWLFFRVNRLPHPKWFDQMMSTFALIMTRGDGWLLGLLVAAIVTRGKQRRGFMRAMRRIAPPLWLVTGVVELGIKRVFRRKRPFLQKAEAILVGLPPKHYSFPSGHAASAFAGAWLLSREQPRGRWLYYAVAAVVAFSRVYKGVHYPGDVIAGALTGMGLAQLFRLIVLWLRKGI